jgi:WD40 repeat protein
MMNKHTLRGVIFLSMLMALMLACAIPGCAQEQEPPAVVVIEEPTAVSVVEEPLEESAWSPYLLFRIDIPEEARVMSFAPLPGDNQMAVGVFEMVYVYQFQDGQFVQEYEVRHRADTVSFSPDGAVMGIGQGAFGADMYDTETGERIIDLHGGNDSRLAYSPDGQMIASSRRGNVLWLWDADDYEQIAEIELPTSEWLMGLAFSPSAPLLAAQRWDCMVNLIDTNTFEILNTLERGERGTCQHHGMAFSPDGAFLAGVEASIDFVHHVRVYDMQEQRVFRDLPLRSRAIDVNFSPDGSMLAAGLNTNMSAGINEYSIILWSVPDLEVLYQLDLPTTGDSDAITTVHFSPDSQQLWVGRWNGVVEVYQVLE